MSSIAISGDTSGAVTLSVPAVAGTNTITVPAATGTMLTTASSGQIIPSVALPVGSVLQVVYAQTNSSVSVATTTFTDLGLSATITPKSSTSKILALWDIRSEFPNNGAGYGIQLVRASTNIYTTVTYEVYLSPSNDFRIKSSWQYLDSPATTSATTYKIQVATNGGANVNFQSNSCYSHLTLMEVAA